MRNEDLDDYGMLSELVQLSQKLKYQMIVLKRVTVNVQGGCKFPSAKLLWTFTVIHRHLVYTAVG